MLTVAAAIIALGMFAQGHPCDAPTPATMTIASGAPHRLQLCAQLTDAPEAMLVTVDGQNFDLVPITPKSQPSAVGQVVYESGQFLQVPKGNHTLQVALYNRNALTGQMQLGTPMPIPLSFAAVDDTPKAAAPKILNIIK